MNIYNQDQFMESFFFLFVGQATSPAEERQDVTVLYNKMTLGELQSTFNFNVRVISFVFCTESHLFKHINNYVTAL